VFRRRRIRCQKKAGKNLGIEEFDCGLQILDFRFLKSKTSLEKVDLRYLGSQGFRH
jgi:hypothetical protein